MHSGMKAENPVLIKPFLRWVGGKQYLVKHLLKYIPSDLCENGDTYFEPFLGAGSLFLAKCPEKAILSDMNPHLIHCFKSVRDSPTHVYQLCKRHLRNSSGSYYYRVRELFNRNIDRFDLPQAARFLYLNRTCFNGVFRVNLSGLFNVPFGRKERVSILTLEGFRQISEVLRGAELETCSYEEVLPKVKKGDFVYLDPPYPPIDRTSYFTHYTKERFRVKDQQRLAAFANELKKRGCRVMISNADIPEVRRLYANWRVERIEVTRYITCKSQRQRVHELIITNY